jgi:membrane-associated phospholipid phosphatase
MAIVHLAIYDAVNTIDGGYAGYLAQRKGPDKGSEAAATARAAHDTLTALYPSRKAIFDDALESSLTRVPDGPAQNKGIAIGRNAAKQILAAREDDGADAIVSYTPGAAPDDWQPTPPAFAPPLLPQWPQVTPFALESGDQFRPPPPPSITSEEFTAAFNQVKSIGSANSITRTQDQTDIALFWADGAGTATPPGHWNLIAADVAHQQHNTLAENARLFALLNVALADAGIASWDSKYFYNFCRPVTAIHNAAADGDPNTMPDADWSPLLTTPPFPSYISGHSTFSAAAATILAGFFGTDRITFTTGSENPAASARTFTSFSQAANEAGISRIYAGIHWDFDNTAGLATGKAVGNYVLAHSLRPDTKATFHHGADNQIPSLPPAARLFNRSSQRITAHS